MAISVVKEGFCNTLLTDEETNKTMRITSYPGVNIPNYVHIGLDINEIDAAPYTDEMLEHIHKAIVKAAQDWFGKEFIPESEEEPVNTPE